MEVGGYFLGQMVAFDYFKSIRNSLYFVNNQYIAAIKINIFIILKLQLSDYIADENFIKIIELVFEASSLILHINSLTLTKHFSLIDQRRIFKPFYVCNVSSVKLSSTEFHARIKNI
jgi:hypothetical protein